MTRIKGITIELDGDTTGLTKALKNVDSETKKVQTELKQVDKLLKFDPSNVDLLSQKQKLLGNAIDSTSKRLDTLRQAQSQVEQQFKNGEIGEEAFRKFQREIIATEGKLKAFKQQADNVQLKIEAQADTSGIDKMKAALKELGPSAKQAASEIGNALKDAATVGSAAVTGLVVGMADTNKDLAMLATQIGEVGLSLEDIGNSRTVFDSIGQETDQVTEAMGNLIQAGYDTRDSIEEISTSLAGAVVKYGDTFNIEGLAESITTTTQLGEVTGQLTDLLEKEGINVDTFNAKIQGMATEQERANYISQLLADQGLTSLYNKYAETNSEIVNASAAQLSLTDSLSQLSVALTPLVTKVTEVVTKIVEWANENQGLATALAIASGAIAALSGAFAVLSPIVSAITAIWPVLAGAFGAITAPVAIAIAAVVALGVAAVALWKNWDEVSAFLKKTWESISSTAKSAFTAVSDTIQRVWTSIKSATSSTWDSIKNAINSVVSAIKSQLDKYWSSMESGVKKTWDGIKQTLKGAWDAIKNIFAGALLVILQALTGEWDEAKKSTEKIWKNIQNALKDVWEGLKKIFSGALSAIGGVLKTAWDNIKSTTTSVFNSVKTTISSAWDSVKSATSSVLSSISSAASTKFNEMKTAISNKMSEIRSAISDAWNNVVSFFRNINLRSIGSDIMSGLLSGISSGAQAVYNKARDIADRIKDTIAGALKIKSPSRVMIGFGENIGEGLVIGMDDMIRKVSQSSERLSDAVSGAHGSLSNSGSKSEQARMINNTNTTSTINNSKYMQPSITIVNQASNASPSEIARKALQAQRQLAMEWGV